MISLIVYLIPFLLGVVVLVAITGVISQVRRLRTAPYYRIRQAATRQAWQWVLIALAAAVGIAAAIYARRFVPPLDRPFRLTASQPEGTPLATLNLDVIPTPGQQPTGVEAPPTITPNLSPEPGVTGTPVIATIESDVTLPPAATLSITAISSGISALEEPVNVDTSFPAGTQRIYFWLSFSSLADGLSWSQVLLLNDEVVRSESESWAHGAEGTSFYWFEAQGGWPAGSYEAQFYLGDTLAARADFSIID